MESKCECVVFDKWSNTKISLNWKWPQTRRTVFFFFCETAAFEPKHSELWFFTTKKRQQFRSKDRSHGVILPPSHPPKKNQTHRRHPQRRRVNVTCSEVDVAVISNRKKRWSSSVSFASGRLPWLWLGLEWIIWRTLAKESSAVVHMSQDAAHQRQTS